MSDVKLFRIGDKAVSELEGHSAAVEKSIKPLLDKYREDFVSGAMKEVSHAESIIRESVRL